MRPNQQNKNRSRGRNNGGRKHNNPLSRNFESNGPDVKIRGNASHIAEKYLQLARDAQASGDSVMAENYLQHAEHYFRILSAAQPQQQPRNDGNSDFDDSDDGDSDSSGDFNDNQRENPRGSRRDRNRDNRNRRDNTDRDENDDSTSESESEKAPAAAQASDAKSADEDGEQVEAKPKRERRPRRRKQAETSDDGGDESTVGELPAFLTGQTSAAE